MPSENPRFTRKLDLIAHLGYKYDARLCEAPTLLELQRPRLMLLKHGLQHFGPGR